jgi:hypothetical protein
MSSRLSSQKIRVAIAVTTADDPTQAAEVAAKLASDPAFELRIVGCRIPSIFDLPPCATMIGMPMSVIEPYVRTRWAEIEQTCNEMIGILDGRLPRNAGLEACYVGGPLNRMVPTLASMTEIVTIPHSLKLTTKSRIRRPVLDSLLVKSNVPTMFCADTTTCRKLVVVEIDAGIGFGARRILSRLADVLGVPVNRWLIRKSNSKKPVSLGAGGPESFGPGHDYESDDESILADQSGIWLVIPAHVVLHPFRFRQVQSVLCNWQQNCLVLP